MKPNVDRQGFTLIELLIVVVIVGVLAAIAIPKFARSREKAYVAAMRSDLRSLLGAQVAYRADQRPPAYASSLAELAAYVSPSAGVNLTITAATPTGFGATATHANVPGVTCAVFRGDAATPPATQEGEVACD